MKKRHVPGAVIAGAAAALFFAAPALAGDEAASGDKSVKCMGGNECKGHGACGGAGHDCAGKNECKGKGWIKTSSAEECKEKGGTPEEG